MNSLEGGQERLFQTILIISWNCIFAIRAIKAEFWKLFMQIVYDLHSMLLENGDI